jgi:hypothetical protein
VIIITVTMDDSDVYGDPVIPVVIAEFIWDQLREQHLFINTHVTAQKKSPDVE